MKATILAWDEDNRTINSKMARLVIMSPFDANRPGYGTTNSE